MFYAIQIICYNFMIQQINSATFLAYATDYMLSILHITQKLRDSQIAKT